MTPTPQWLQAIKKREKAKEEENKKLVIPHKPTPIPLLVSKLETAIAALELLMNDGVWHRDTMRRHVQNTLRTILEEK